MKTDTNTATLQQMLKERKNNREALRFGCVITDHETYNAYKQKSFWEGLFVSFMCNLAIGLLGFIMGMFTLMQFAASLN